MKIFSSLYGLFLKLHGNQEQSNEWLTRWWLSELEFHVKNYGKNEWERVEQWEDLRPVGAYNCSFIETQRCAHNIEKYHKNTWPETIQFSPFPITCNSSASDQYNSNCILYIRSTFRQCNWKILNYHEINMKLAKDVGEGQGSWRAQ